MPGIPDAANEYILTAIFLFHMSPIPADTIKSIRGVKHYTDLINWAVQSTLNFLKGEHLSLQFGGIVVLL